MIQANVLDQLQQKSQKKKENKREKQHQKLPQISSSQFLWLFAV